jgi:hypothetical protein
MIRQAVAYLLLTATALAVANVYYGPPAFRLTRYIENSFVYTDADVGRTHFENISRFVREKSIKEILS